MVLRNKSKIFNTVCTTPIPPSPAFLISTSHLSPSFIVSGQVGPSSVSIMQSLSCLKVSANIGPLAPQFAWLSPTYSIGLCFCRKIFLTYSSEYFSNISFVSFVGITKFCSFFLFQDHNSYSLLHLLHLGYYMDETVGAESMHKWQINIDCPKQNWFLVWLSTTMFSDTSSFLSQTLMSLIILQQVLLSCSRLK